MEWSKDKGKIKQNKIKRKDNAEAQRRRGFAEKRKRQEGFSQRAQREAHEDVNPEGRT